jgi:uncharacterized protein with ATP-grasp and redox domains
MNTKKAIINKIKDLVADDCTDELAEKMFNVMREDGRVFYANDNDGLMIRDGVDLISVAEEVLNG